MKVCVIGTSGAGKSTFSARLAEKKALQHIEMDRFYWQKPNWQEPDFDEFRGQIDEATAGDSWVLDGNYSRTNPLKFSRADTIVWIDYSLPRTCIQALRRAIRRVIRREELWPGTGNRETFRQTFMSRQSILLWTLKTFRSNRERHLEWMASDACAHLNFVRLRSPAEAKRWLDQL